MSGREATAWLALAGAAGYRLGWLNAAKKVSALAVGKPAGVWAKAKAWYAQADASAGAKIVTPEEFEKLVEQSAQHIQHAVQDDGNRGYS